MRFTLLSRGGTRRCASLIAILVSASSLFASIGAGLQLQLGNPSNATADATNRNRYLLQRPQYSLDYSDTNGDPNWVSWNLTTGDVGSSGRSNFLPDPDLPAGFYAVQTGDYTGSGFDRGHMCPSADRTVTAADNQIVFYLSNIIPQAADNNQGPWASFENYCRTLAGAGNELLIISGPSGFAGSRIPSGKAAIPGYTWKIVVVVPTGAGTALSRVNAASRVIALKMPNIAGIRNNPWQNYIVSAAQIETDTGYNFFRAIEATDATLAATLRAKVDGQTATGTPVISTQPVAQSAAVGGSATFSVAATGDTPLTYVWSKDGVDLADATGSSLTLTNVQAADVGDYTVTVSNAVGSVTSSAASLVITGLPPTITAAPVARTAAAGTTVAFSVGASGSPTLSYQWRKAGANLVNSGTLSGSTTTTLTLANVQAADAASYDVVVTNSVGSVTSAAVTLTVTPAGPTIVAQPTGRTATTGGTATFTVTASGTAPLTYQWRKAGTALTGNTSATTATLTLTNVQAADAGSYDVVVANSVGPDATSTAASLTVSAAGAGQVAYAGGTYSQNFDTLPASGTFALSGNGPHLLDSAPINASGLPGWSLAKFGGSGANAVFTIGTGSGNSGSVYSFGATGASERALGSLGSSSVQSRLGVVLVNTTGQTITEFTVNYTGEQWRHGGATTANTLAFSYGLGATDLNTGTFTNVTALDFVGLSTTATAATLDGNLAANRSARSATVTGVTWAAGQTLVLRWTDVDDAGSDDGLAIDDFSFSAVTSGGPTLPAVASTSPAASATGVATNAPITVTFNQAVTVSGAWFSLSSAAKGVVEATVTGGPTTFTLTPPLNIEAGDTISVKLVAAQITDQATGTLRPAADYTFSFVTAVPVAPTVTTPPQAQTVAAGSKATFTVAASGSAPLSYQWRKGGTALAGNTSATTAVLVLPNAQADDAASYDVVVANSVASATSAPAALTVTPAAPTLITSPVAQTATPGGTATFSVVATGTAPLSYQWRKGGVAITGNTSATTANLILANVQAADAANYDVVVANSVNPPATSSAVALTVGLTPAAGQLNYSGGTYSQNFDTLPATGTFTFTGDGPFALDAATPAGVAATGLPGWTFSRYSGTGTAGVFRVDTGAANSGAVYSYGSGADRALGSIGSGSTASRFGLVLLNNTAQTITQFTLAYTGEQWRRGSAAANKLAFEYAVAAASINSGTFLAAPALDFTAPVTTGADLPLDGNAAANRSAAPISATITGLAWAPGQTLVLRWSDTNDGGNDDGLAIDDLTFTTGAPAATAPAITTQPVAQTTTVGGTATFTVAATGTAPLSYQWRKDGTAITGNTSATTTALTLVNAQAADAGNYDVVVTNGVNPPATSTAVALTVNPAGTAPAITTQPIAQTVTAGGTATFTVVANGTAPLSYQWRKGGAAITGNTSATTATLTLAGVQAADAGSYDVVVANGTLPNATSSAVTLTVNPAVTAPAITTPPVAQSVTVGGTATFTVVATGTAPLSYQWRKDGTAITGNTSAATATLTLAGVQAADAGSYDVVVANGTLPNATSSAAVLTVNLPPPAPTVNYPGGTYSQSFDTLPETGTFIIGGTGAAIVALSAAPINATGLAGWSFSRYAGTGTTGTTPIAPLFSPNSGSSNSGSVFSYGAATGPTTDRALGTLASGSTVSRFGVAFVNTTAQTITQFSLGYTGEQWRHGGATTANKLAFAYLVGAADINTGAFVAVPALDFTAPIITVTAGALDGNASANRVVISPVTVTGISWAPGQTLVLRWTDVDDSGSDDGLAIDDLVFSLTPPVTAPNIATQPAAQSATAGGSVSLSVSATGTAPLSYQWRKNGTQLAGATDATLVLSGVATTATGAYDVVVTNTAGSATSNAASVTVTKGAVALTLENLAQTYDGAPRRVAVRSNPFAPAITVTYAGSTTAPTDAGSYAVVASVDDATLAGSVSGTLVVAKAAQTVAFSALPAAPAIGVAFSVSAAASSGLPVTLTVAGGNASANGSSVTLNDSAPVTLRASQAGNANLLAAFAEVTLSANSAAKRDQTITFAALADRAVPAAPITLAATASSGLPVAFALVSGPATLTGNLLTLDGAAGSVTVRASQPGDAAFNAAPSVERTFTVTVPARAPVITRQPAAQTALAGGGAAFSVAAEGSPALAYQWRKDGAPVAGATGPALALAAAQATDAGGYDVVVTNAAGSVTSSLARLTVSATPAAPVLLRQPGGVVVVLGRAAGFAVVATGSPAPAYQWRKDGVPLAGATGPAFALAAVTAADAGQYSVVVSNSAGSVTSAAAPLGVIRRSYAGTYFGSLGGGGTFALRVNDDNTGVFLAFAPGSRTAYVSRGVNVSDNGSFRFVTTTTGSGTAAATHLGQGTPPVAAAVDDLVIEGSISESGALSAAATTGSPLSLSGTRTADSGTAAASAGFYQASAANSSATTLAIVSPTGQTLVVTQTGSGVDGGTGTVDAAGKVTVTTTGQQTIAATLSAERAALTATVTTAGGAQTTFTGFAGNSAAAETQRLVNVSTRTTAGTGDQVAIVGFVIIGLESKTVLVRAVGPALRDFGITTALAAPRLELQRSGAATPLATNTGWGTSGNSAELANAAARSGAFPLAAGSADSVILATLAPGAYTAVVTAADGRSGVGLVEVYDLSGGSNAQRLANLSTRALAGAGDATLISGLVVSGSAPKRVLIRAAGPALAQFGVSGVLTRPQLTLFSGAAVVAANAGWSTSADAAAIAEAAARTGAFAFGATSADAALTVNLAPGAYTAQITGAGGTSGIALLEIYEVP